jgi:hypothetical protein
MIIQPDSGGRAIRAASFGTDQFGDPPTAVFCEVDSGGTAIQGQADENGVGVVGVGGVGIQGTGSQFAGQFDGDVLVNGHAFINRQGGSIPRPFGAGLTVLGAANEPAILAEPGSPAGSSATILASTTSTSAAAVAGRGPLCGVFGFAESGQGGESVPFSEWTKVQFVFVRVFRENYPGPG